MAPVTRSQRSGRDAATGHNHDPAIITSRLRPRTARPTQKSDHSPTTVFAGSGHPSRHGKASRGDTSDEPPRFIIDLSLPPEQRYLEVCAAFEIQMLDLTALFDEVVGGMVTFLPLSWLRFLCKVFLRRIYNDEENAELVGISRAVGIDMYLLVCFNVLLDLMMGCSSGGARVRDEESTTGGSKMLHFRTLDWNMPALRQIVVQLDFCLHETGPVIASSITYAGFVGVLTGVRPGLSLSLNFRPNRIDNGRFWSSTLYFLHLVLVLLGLRASISSTLRSFLVPRAAPTPASMTSRPAQTSLSAFEEVIGAMTGMITPILTTTVCYLCFCSGHETVVIEKDHRSATSRTSQEFIVVTNADSTSPAKPMASSSIVDTEESAKVTLNEVIAEAKDRERCAVDNWQSITAASCGRNSSFTRSAGIKDVVNLVRAYPTTNECTHFACVLDPTIGTVRWCRRYHAID
ncbi:hypothetical protein LTR86_003255 [Recurvomyces mirabilis]|nr:hypothetical protein LTR86_003255 [Recurvomyces mirabilis]